MKPKLLVSFSGGKTSAYMSHLIKERWSDKYEIGFVFANTGQEREETLEFIQRCDEHFHLGVVWIEAVVNQEKGKGVRHKVVNFKTASRDGEPFEQAIRKYGIPNAALPQCTSRLKAEPIESYERSIGWKDCLKAIGIRADESGRLGNNSRFLYPMARDWMLDKIDVNNFWERMPFNLNLLEHHGNCSWCWRKSDRKLMMLIQESPQLFDFPRRMEKKYASHKADKGRRVFFRQERSTDDLFNQYNIIASSGEIQMRMFDDESSGCTESCEPFTGDTE